MTQTTTIVPRLEGSKLLLTRILWVAATLVSFGYFAMLMVNIPRLVEINNARGFVPVAWYDHIAWWLRSDIVHSSIIFFVFAIGATILFFQRNNELPAVFYSIMYMLLGALPIIANESLKDFYRDLPMYLQVFRAISFFLVALVTQIGLYTYPDLRYVPTMFRHLVWWFVFVAGYYAIRFWMVGYATGDMVAVSFISLLGGILVQVYRYRNTKSGTQHQQIKWGAVSFAALILFHLITIPLFEYIHNPINNVPVNQQFYGFMFLILLLTAGYIINLGTFFIAIIRYRLWDINIVLSRSLVYSSLTLLLVGIFALAFFVLRSVFGLFLAGLDDTVAVASASVLVATLFTPTRKRVRRFVDRTFFGIELDYREAMRLYALQEASLDSFSRTTADFSKFHNLELVGSGGMGKVYKAYDDTAEGIVAIKILVKNDSLAEEITKRFEREAQAIAMLNHPNIVKLYEHGAHEDTPFMVMEYIEGKSLSEKVEAVGRFSLDDALPLLSQIAAALDHAHEKRIIHRDVKLSNIMLEENKTEPRAILMDFGIAHLGGHMTQLTKSGRMMGTLDYISPEQIVGAGAVEHYTDIYSLGVAAYKILTGALPFEHNNPGALVLAHIKTPAPDPRALVDLPEQTAFAILRALRKEPTQRFNTAMAFIDALGEGSTGS